jgi:SAM-dependent methyltransferase
MHGLIEAEHLARYRWAAACVSGLRALDAGCGVGYGSLLLRDAGATSVTGIDISQEAIDVASTRAAEGTRFLLGDIMALPLEDASFDVAVCFEAIEHVQNQDLALDELRRVLTPEGLLIISSPNRAVYQEGNPHHTHEYTPDEFLAALESRFANVRLERQQAWLTSMVCDDTTLSSPDFEHPLEVEVRKIAAIPAGLETFTLALAGHTPLPPSGSVAFITDLDELGAWRTRARSAEEHLERSQRATYDLTESYEEIVARYGVTREDYLAAHENYQNALVALDATQGELAHHQQNLNRTATLLAERNAALRIAADELIELRARTAQVEAQLAVLRSSKSWSLTKPLRTLARAYRQTRKPRSP